MAEENSSKTIITLKSSEGQEFIISKKGAMLSETIKGMVEEDDSSNVFPLDLVDSKTLADVITFLNKGVECDNDEKKKIVYEEFVAGKELNDLTDLILAANYLEIKDLLNLLADKIADLIKDKSVNWIRRSFNIANDFSPQEEQKLMEDHGWAHQGAQDD